MTKQNSRDYMPRDSSIHPDKKPSVAFAHLGCEKNRVDTEHMIGLLAEAGYGVSTNEDDAEATKGPTSGTDNDIDILSNGFKIRNADSAQNGNNELILYAAFAEHPFKLARAR